MDPLADDDWARLDRARLPAPVVADGVARWTGVIYASPPGFRPLEMDIYAEVDAVGPRPAVVWIHGGAFALGTRKFPPAFLADMDFFGRLARAGFVVATIDYRLSGEARWPAQLADVRAAIRWLVVRADELGIDPSAIATWGESAGAHLAVMAGVLGGTTRAEEIDGLDLPRVGAVVDWYGPTDFRQMDAQGGADSAMSHDAADSPESRLLGAPVQLAGPLVDDANPVAHVRPGVPPFLIRHGRLDRLVPFGQSELLAARLESVRADVTFHAVDDAGHVFEGHPHPEEFVDEAIAFLRRALPLHSASAAAPLESKGTQ